MKYPRIDGVCGVLITVLWFVLAILFAPGVHAQTGETRGANAGATPAATLGTSAAAARLLPDLARALAREAGTDDLVLTLDQPTRAIALDDSGAPIIRSISYNPATGRFVIRGLDTDHSRLVALSGVARDAVMIPVPAHDIARGATITEDDLEFITAGTGDAHNVAEASDDLVGMAPRRTLPAGAPVRRTDLVAPTLVERGDIVTMVVHAPGLRLTHKGLAREAGAHRDIINVENVRSGRTIRAVVISDGLVEAAGPAEDDRANRRSRS